MSLKEKIKSYSFWVSLASAIILILKVIGAKFGFDIDESLASSLVTSLCSILVLLGIIVTPAPKTTQDDLSIQNQIKMNSNPTTIFNNVPEVDSITEINNDDSTFAPIQNIEKENIIIEDISNESQINMIETNDCVVSQNTTQLIDLNTNQNNSELSFNDCVSENIHFEGQKVDNQHDDKSNVELQNILHLQKQLFANNISKYIEILETEINSLKTDENI